jgi:hypothetical protein
VQKYAVTLKSRTDDQTRFVTLSERSAELARIRCEAAELEVVNYDLRSDPYLSAKTIREIERGEFSPEGKVLGLRGRKAGKLHQAAQTQPYQVVSVEPVRLSGEHVSRLVRELTALQHDEEAWQRLLQTLRDNGTPLAVLGWQYGVPKKNQYDGTAVVDWDTDTIKCMLLTGHTPAQDTHDFVSDVVANEVTGTGYTADGATLGSKTATYDTASDQMRLDAADTSWTTSTITASEAVVYKDTGTDATSPLIAGLDFEANVSSTAGTFQITWDSTGIVVDDLT